MTPAGVQLTPMTPDELDAYLLHAVDGYRRQRVEFGGETDAQARAAAERDFAELFPAGQPGPNQFLFVARDPNDQRVGVLWVAQRARADQMMTFIYDIQVDLYHRRQGWGQAIMAAAEDWARENGSAQVALNVFGGNVAARSLYSKIGYTERAVIMAKEV
jgi:GNAT superfamily N-acetyltransferase